MTTATLPPQSTLRRAAPQPSTIGFGNVLKSEWTKLRTVRSTFWTTAIAVLATGIVGVAVCISTAHDVKTGNQTASDIDAVMTSLTGLILVQLTAGALGVMTISSEYGTGMIRATLGAVPQRRAMLAAKGLVFATVTFVIGEILSFGGALVGQAILHSQHAGVSLSDGANLRATFGGGLYITAIGLLGFGLGALIRNTAGALSTFFGIVFAASALVNLLPHSWQDHVSRYLPMDAGSQILSTQTDHGSLSPWHGFAVLCLYPLVAITAAAILIKRRDA